MIGEEQAARRVLAQLQAAVAGKEGSKLAEPSTTMSCCSARLQRTLAAAHGDLSLRRWSRLVPLA